jgi:hypothetical protein
MDTPYERWYLLKRKHARQMDATFDSTTAGQVTVSVTGGVAPYTIDAPGLIVAGMVLTGSAGTYTISIRDERRTQRYYDVRVN